MMRILLILFLIYLIGCDKSPTCEYINRTMTVDVKVENLKDTLTLSDTLWIEMEVPRFIEIDSERLEFVGDLFGTFVLSARTVTEFDLISEISSFHYTDDCGKIHLFEDVPFAYFEFVTDEELAKIRFGLTPKFEGSYLLTCTTLLFDPKPALKNVETGCSNIINDFHFIVQSDIENNNYQVLINDAVEEYLPPIYTEENFRKGGGIAFIVKE